MPQSMLTGQLKEKPTYRVWCLHSSFVQVVHVYLREWNVPLELEGELLAPVGRLVFGAHQHVVEQEQVTQFSSPVWLKGQLTNTVLFLFKGTDNYYRES
jgi:hypothetical protein